MAPAPATLLVLNFASSSNYAELFFAADMPSSGEFGADRPDFVGQIQKPRGEGLVHTKVFMTGLLQVEAG